MDVFSISEIDNAIEARVKAIVVASGHWVDEKALVDAGRENELELELAKLTKPIIEVYGVGAPKDSINVDVARIRITRYATLVGDVGFQRKPYFESYVENVDGEDRTFFRKYNTPKGLYNINYSVRYACNDTETDQALTQILINAFSSAKYLKGVDDNGNFVTGGFYLMQDNNPVEINRDDYIERLYRYEAKDICLESFELVEEKVASIETIEVNIADNESEDTGNILQNVEVK